MARCPSFLLLVALAALANVQAGVAGCWYQEWPCQNGECILAAFRCNGGPPNCSDGSDEDTAKCDKTPSIRVQEGQVTTVRTEYKQEFHSVYFLLCGGTYCSKLNMRGRTADGVLWYFAKTKCNTRGGFCESLHRESVPRGRREFYEGPVVFKVQRRRSELAVWLDDHEDQVATVPVDEGSDLLVVKPGMWSSDLGVQFNVTGSRAPVEGRLPGAPEDGNRVTTEA